MTIDEYLDSIGINPKGLPFTDEYIKWLEERHREMLKALIWFYRAVGQDYNARGAENRKTIESATNRKWSEIKEALDD